MNETVLISGKALTLKIKILQTLATLETLLFSGVVFVVLQAFYSLFFAGKVVLNIFTTTHYLYYTQIYLKAVSVSVSVVLLLYFALKCVYIKKFDTCNVKQFILSNDVLIPLVFMLLWAFVSTLLSTNVKVSFLGSGYTNEGFFTILQYGVIFLAAYISKDKIRQAKDIILWVFISSATLVCFIMLLKNQLGLPLNSPASSGVFNNSNHFGYFLAMSSSAVFAAIVYSKNFAVRCVLMVSLALNVYCLYISKTLGAHLGYLVAILFVVVSAILTKKINYKNLAVAVAVSLMVTIVVNVTKESNIFNQYLKLLQDIGLVSDDLLGGSDASGAGTGRIGLWKRTLNIVAQVPLFGKGLDIYKQNNIFDNTLDMPHNEYLQVASNIGLPAAIVYVGFIIWWFIRSYKQRNLLSVTNLILMAASIAYIVSAFFGNTFTYTYPYFLIFITITLRKPQRTE